MILTKQISEEKSLQDNLQDKSVILTYFVLQIENTIFPRKSVLLESSQMIFYMIP